MKYLFVFFTFSSLISFAQIDKDQLALQTNKADTENMQQLQQFIWKRHSTASVGGEVKSKLITEFSFDTAGKLQATVLDAQASEKQKGGIRGQMQQSAMEDNMEYVQQALELSLAYTYMSKGQLMDFFDKATIVQNGNVIEATAQNVFVKGDKLIVQLDAETKLYINKTFSSLLGTDPISGEIKYEKFSSGINHVSTTVLNLAAKNAKIEAVNQDYTIRVK